MYPSPINRLRSLCGQKSQVNLIGSRGKCLPINNRKQSSGISFQIRTRISISMSLMYFIMCIICLLITIGSGTKFFYIYYGRLVPGKKKVRMDRWQHIPACLTTLPQWVVVLQEIHDHHHHLLLSHSCSFSLSHTRWHHHQHDGYKKKKNLTDITSTSCRLLACLFELPRWPPPCVIIAKFIGVTESFLR